MNFAAIAYIPLMLVINAFLHPSRGQGHLPAETHQAVIVATGSWDSSAGELQLYEKEHGKWSLVRSGTPVTVGRNGLGWGRGMVTMDRSGPVKSEGDGRAPAGIFHFGAVFGYEDAGPQKVTLEYKPCTDRDYFIDDVLSPDYNRWVTIPAPESNSPTDRWKSFERMRRSDHLYRWGIVVQHNMAPTVPGKGSAIFLHIWRRPGSPTSGCTAMDETDLLEILGWLQADKQPVLIQLPVDELDRLGIRE